MVRPTLRSCDWRRGNEWYIYLSSHFCGKANAYALIGISNLTMALHCSHGRCRTVVGNQDGSGGMAATGHSAMWEVTGRQESRRNGMDVMIYLVKSPTAAESSRQIITSEPER